MRNWDEESPAISHPSRKSTSGTLNEADTITMGSIQLKNVLTDSNISQEKYVLKDKEFGSLTSTKGTTVFAPAPFSEADTKKLLRKLDLHLIPFLALLYL
jgi:hypothetical protein